MRVIAEPTKHSPIVQNNYDERNYKNITKLSIWSVIMKFLIN